HMRILITHQGRHGASKPGETLDELRGPDIDIVRPAVMTDVPDRLRPCLPCGLQLRQKARPVVTTRPAFDAMPSQAIPHGRNPMALQGSIVRYRKHIVSCAVNEVQAATI